MDLRRKSAKGQIRLNFPEYQYDSKPMTLYWYASTATEMPLLQYLAYYQVIEYYFPFYAEQKTHELIKRLLKDPSFESNLDENIGRLLMLIKTYMGKGGYVDERSSLTAAIEKCLTSYEILRFIKAEKDRYDFFTSKSDWKVVASEKIIIDPDNLVNSIARRIYEIRCKIVHTKSADGDFTRSVDLLLPYSKEAQRLEFDIELIRFVSRKILIGSAKPLELQ